jgi:hypothetical protein
MGPSATLGAADGVEEIGVPVASDTLPRALEPVELPFLWMQTLPSLRQLLQIGSVSSHLTFLFLQVKHPVVDLHLNVRVFLAPGEGLESAGLFRVAISRCASNIYGCGLYALQIEPGGTERGDVWGDLF